MSGGKGGEKGKSGGKNGQVCDYCGKRGHDRSRCWTLHPEQLPWKSANAVEEELGNWGYDGMEMSVCGVDLDACEAIKPRRKTREMGVQLPPPGLPLSNQFGALAGLQSEEHDDWEERYGHVGDGEFLKPKCQDQCGKGWEKGRNRHRASGKQELCSSRML